MKFKYYGQINISIFSYGKCNPNYWLVNTKIFCLFYFSVTQHKINTVAINSTSDWLAFGSASLGQLLVWEWQSETYVLKQQGHFYNMNVMAYSPDGQFIVTGGDDGKVSFHYKGQSTLRW